MEYGTVFRDERRRRGWSQAAVARRVGISRSQINNIEAGRAGGSPRVLEALCRLYGLEPEAIGLLLNPVESPQLPEPNHPGVRELAADTLMCQAHRITLDELHELASLIIIAVGQSPIVIETKAEALAYLSALRSAKERP